MRDEYKPNERVCRKVAQLWRRKMERPRFDQLGNSRSRVSDQEVYGEMLAQSMIDSMTKDTSAEQLDTFERRLFDRLMQTEIPSWCRDAADAESHRRYCCDLDVDYHPTGMLLDAMNDAELPAAQAPIKSRMDIYEGGYFDCSFGFGAARTRYYPAPQGLWLLTGLRSDDVAEIATLVDVALEHQDKFAWETDAGEPRSNSTERTR